MALWARRLNLLFPFSKTQISPSRIALLARKPTTDSLSNSFSTSVMESFVSGCADDEYTKVDIVKSDGDFFLVIKLRKESSMQYYKW